MKQQERRRHISEAVGIHVMWSSPLRYCTPRPADCSGAVNLRCAFTELTCGIVLWLHLEFYECHGGKFPQFSGTPHQMPRAHEVCFGLFLYFAAVRL